VVGTTSLPSIVTLDSSTRTFSVFSLDNADAGTYTIQVLAVDSLSSSFDHSATFTLTVNEQLSNKVPVWSGSFSDVSLYVGESWQFTYVYRDEDSGDSHVITVDGLEAFITKSIDYST